VPGVFPNPVPGVFPNPELFPPAAPNPEGPPPSRAPFAYNCSIRGAYRNSQVLYVGCSVSTLIESPSFSTPTPTRAAPPPTHLPSTRPPPPPPAPPTHLPPLTPAPASAPPAAGQKIPSP